MCPHIVRIWLQYTAALVTVFEMSMEHQDMFDMLVIIQYMVGGRVGVILDISCYLALIAFSHLYNNLCVCKPPFKGL